MRLSSDSLSRRERQLMDIVFAKGQASVAEVIAALPDPPSYSAVRALLRILEEKGHLTHREEGKQYIYFPTQERPVAAQSALKRVVQTFFGGSVERAVTALLNEDETQLSDEELARLAELIEQAKRKDHA
ncbi:BlaI/MecI/CopY family transcriptional regulator [Armatimonas sp.]|uniref:BlaI/MecI/CopY family transcriptional regulator n=1 Tax=Armatimonas sp. TaxID=1872638 RepID=UPI00286C0A17|nr:BlaI/MecI/CopY family transcriptional regulator [Armatimonas sp.]